MNGVRASLGTIREKSTEVLNVLVEAVDANGDKTPRDQHIRFSSQKRRFSDFHHRPSQPRNMA
jgi:hypothetical protein